jgi:carbonic anhydrase
MSTTDEVIRANQAFSRFFSLANLPVSPARNLAVVACMDARLNVEQILGLKTGDAHIIRNAGGVVTVDALRSLLISQHLLGTQEVVIINHTGCGMLTFRDDQLSERLEKETGTAVVEPVHFHSFTDLRENVRRQIERVRSHPWVPETVSVRGFIYDVKTGKLEDVASGSRLKAAG